MYQYHVFNLLLPFIGAITGMGIALLVRPKTPASPKLILAFSGAFLLGITLFHLMPIVFNSPNLEAGVWIMGGVLLQILLEYISQGVEHGHAHGDKFKDRFPFFLLLSLCVHAFIEGMPLNGDNPLVWGILVHKIPVGMVLVFILWNNKAKRIYIIGGLFLFAIATSLGSLVTQWFSFSELFEKAIISIVIGMLLHIATTILFESNQGHTFNLKKMISILIAIGIAYFI